MHQDNINTIMNQTGINDEMFVRKIYYKNNKNISDTIIELLNLQKVSRKNPEQQDEFTKMRKILDEKDILFQQIKEHVGE